MIIEVGSVEEFKKVGNEFEKDKYRMYYSEEEGIVILRPTVTTRGRDTLVVSGVSREEIDELVSWWGQAFKIKRVEFDETKWRWL